MCVSYLFFAMLIIGVVNCFVCARQGCGPELSDYEKGYRAAKRELSESKLQ